MKNNQNGFAPIVIVLAVVVVLAAGGIGMWYCARTIKPNPAGQANLPPVRVQSISEGATFQEQAAQQSSSPSEVMTNDQNRVVPVASESAAGAGATANDPTNVKKIQDFYAISSHQADVRVKENTDETVGLAYAFPNQYDNGANDYPANLAPGLSCAHIISIPFHSGNQILRVYYGDDARPMADGKSENSTQCYGDESGAELRLIIYDTLSKTSKYIGTTKNAHYTGNSAGLFLPYAITKDDKNIILKSYMADSGAGGADIDYGYAMIAIPTDKIAGERFIDIPESSKIATSSALFYDAFGKVIYVDEGVNTPPNFKPGPSLDSVVAFRNLQTGAIARNLMEEKDTLYEIAGINEKTNTFTFKSTSLIFSSACPREEGNAYCADKEAAKERIGVLP